MVYVPQLWRHLAKGWSEAHVASGKVAVLGVRRLDVRLPRGEGATVAALARAVEDAWGVDAGETAFRAPGGQRTATSAERPPVALAELGVRSGGVVLLVAGGPDDAPERTDDAPARHGATRTARPGGGSVTVTADAEEEGADAARDTPPAPSTSAQPFTGSSYQLGGGAAGHAGQRRDSAARDQAAAAAERRARAAAAERHERNADG